MYEYAMYVAGAVYNSGEIMGDPGDMFAAFGEDGTVRSYAVMMSPPFGPYNGLPVWELAIFSNYTSGESISFKYYDASHDQILSTYETIIFFSETYSGNMTAPIIFNLMMDETECEDENACNFMEEADCIYSEENYDCDGDCVVEVDCTGTCGGDAVVDECGVCDGDGIDEGACDCYGNTLDGCGVCGGEADGSDCNNDGVDDDCEDEYQIGFESGFFEGESTGDVNHDGDTNVTDIVMIINNILNN